ncbi:EF-hand domain-containing family member C2-like [Condylostylus longicornis]|uniref:EF-hand domain-containing family member C2-like n=1 Tax=Condylostylus longicornis TaxID=2530218 RepID=UPI00244DA382|nr:EF-hand domain-containing family member C2-like [Condylostylus longicornis]
MAQMRIPGVPLLPGSMILDVGKNHFPKTQRFIRYKGISMLSDREPVTRFNSDGNEQSCELPSLYAPKSGPKMPAWITYDKKVLCFYGYFQEALTEVYKAAYQIRKIKLYYYLEDDTIEISEPKVPNSGIPQGCLLSRQRVPKSPPSHHEFITLLDINVNKPIKIYDRVYQITDCDLFSRHFLNRMGINVPDPVQIPVDPTYEVRKFADRKLYVPSNKHFTLAQFLKFDGKVLKFNAYWDDKSEFGEIRNLEVLYYLADDTIEIKEKFPKNSGREAPGTFLKRQKLRKEWTGLPLPGDDSQTTILNVLNNRFVADPLRTGNKNINYYKDSDLQIGAHLSIFGRDIILTDCDEFTKDYYKKKFGMENFTPIPNPAMQSQKRIQNSDTQLPPYNGWGDFIDSEGNCLSIMPKIPPIDIHKFINLDKLILRFGAKMISDIKENNERVFIVSFHLIDDTVQVYELAMRNSGFLGGEFCKRKKQLLPDQNIFSSERPKFYEPYHFHIGATLIINDHVFNLATADEYTLMYMEAHPYQFPFADVETIVAKVREALRPTYKNFVAKYLPEVVDVSTSKDCYKCYIRSDIFRKALIELLQHHINDHEIITLCRAFNFEKPEDKCDRELIRSIVHWEIQRDLWNDLNRVKEHICHLEPENVGYLNETKLRATIAGCRLPFSIDLTNLLIKVLKKNSEGDIEIRDFLSFINTAEHRTSSFAPQPMRKICPKLPFIERGRFVDWKAFIDKIGLEETLKNET